MRTWESKERQHYARSPPKSHSPNYQQQDFSTASLPELLKQSRLENPPDETGILDGVIF